MNLLRTAIGLPFVKSFVLGQGRIYAAMAGGYFVQHGVSAGYSQDQITGAICCMIAIALQAVDNYAVHGKWVVALNTPVPIKAPGALPS